MLSQEHLLVKKSAGEFATNVVEPLARRMDRENYYPREAIREAARLGLLAPTIPSKYGGGDGDLRTAVVVVEELAKTSGAFGFLTAISGVVFTHSLFTHGSGFQRGEVLARVATGEAVGAFALSEPCCGSDAAAIETRAEKVGGEWRIDGVKTWITSGLYADYFLVFARTGAREERHKTITAFIVKRGSCVETSPIEVMGMRGTGTAEVKFSQCSVSDDDVVGRVNGGWEVIAETLNAGRVAISGVALGVATGAFEEAWGWARQRRLFGQRLVDFQNAQFELAEMYAAIETMRALAYYAAYLFDVGRREEFITMAHVAKLQTARLAVEVTRKAVQMLGGYGYSKESKSEMFYRDAKALEIGGGTIEAIRHILYKTLDRRQAARPFD
ncbi:MAG: acyl-CoA dehydrogenase family protein [Pyrobaculum sp.]